MKKLKFEVGPRFALALPLLLSFGCQGAGTGEDQAALGQTGLYLTSDVLDDTDVARIRYEITPVDCSTGEPTGDATTTAVEDFADFFIPGGISELEDAPLDAESEHMFADHFATLPAGCYDVTTTPLTSTGEVSADCAAAVERSVEVLEGETTEIFLINQCGGTDPGALDAISTLNHPPKIDVEFERSKFVTCDEEQVICATVTDPDNDPIELVWEVSADSPSATPLTVTSSDYDEETGTLTECVSITPDEAGRFDLDVYAYDLLHDDGVLKRIEDYLAEEGYPSDSHGHLSFPFYTGGCEEMPPCVVTHTDDTGVGSLREAIHCANLMPERGYVAFRIEEEGPYVFNVVTNLPSLVNPNGVVLDGADQAASGLGTGPQDIVLQAAGAWTGIISDAPTSLVANMSILDMGRGVIFYQGSTLENVDVSSPGGFYGISVHEGASIIRNVQSRGFLYGMTIYAAGTQILDSVVDAGAYGINISESDVLVQDTSIRSPSFTLNLDAPRGTLRRVTLRDSIFRMNLGFSADFTTVEDCDIGDGRILSNSDNNTLTGSLMSALSLSGNDNTVTANRFSSTGFGGITVNIGERNRLSQNVGISLPTWMRLISLTAGTNGDKVAPTLSSLACSASDRSFSGTADPGDRIEIFTALEAGGNAEQYRATALAAADGTFTITFPDSGSGTDPLHVTATATSAVGNTSAHSPTVSLTCP